MKKSTLAVTLVAALTLIYPATAWLTGQRLEKGLTLTLGQEFADSGFRIVKQNYTRGVFSSTQESTLEMSRAGIDALIDHPRTTVEPSDEREAQADGIASTENSSVSKQDALKISVNDNPLQVKVINHIVHGPVPGYFGVAAARIETEFVIDEAILAEIKKVYGEKKILEIRTILNYLGGGSTKISTPAVSTTTDGQVKVDWKGAQLELGFSEGFGKLHFDFNAQGLDVTGSQAGGKSLKLGAIHFASSAERADNLRYIYTSVSKAGIKSIEIADLEGEKTTFSMKDLGFSSQTALKKDLLEMSLKFGIASMSYNQVELGVFHYDYSLANLHAPSLNQLVKEMYALKSKDGVQTSSAELQDKVKKLLQELMQHRPTLSLDRLSLSGPKGEFSSAGKLSLGKISFDEMVDPKQLLTKLESDVNIRLAEELVRDLIERTQTDTNARAMANTVFDTQIAKWETEGFLQRKDKILTSKVIFKEGKWVVNGKPYPAPLPIPAESAGIGSKRRATIMTP